jgi:hypothetical protein
MAYFFESIPDILKPEGGLIQSAEGWKNILKITYQNLLWQNQPMQKQLQKREL